MAEAESAVGHSRRHPGFCSPAHDDTVHRSPSDVIADLRDIDDEDHTDAMPGKLLDCLVERRFFALLGERLADGASRAPSSRERSRGATFGVTRSP